MSDPGFPEWFNMLMNLAGRCLEVWIIVLLYRLLQREAK